MIIRIRLSYKTIRQAQVIINRNSKSMLFSVMLGLSVSAFFFYYITGLGLAYNDARSHLDIGRRVVEGLKPGFAQLGSVWLPLPHLLMTPTIWIDFMWHSGLAGAMQSMISFIATALLIYAILKTLGVSLFGRLIGVLVFILNLNILYLQSTAMTELLLLATMTAAMYELILWQKSDSFVSLIKAAFWMMLATLIRYEGWFLLLYSGALLVLLTVKRKGYKTAEGMFLLFATLAGFGVFLWFLWNQLIFKDALYFVFGPYSAAAQQAQLNEAGVLATKGNIILSIKIYLYALLYNSGVFTAILGAAGAIVLWFDKRISLRIRLMSTTLATPFLYNVLALYLGQSVLFIQGISGNTWFNVRYGIMMMPSIAIFVGFLVDRARSLRYVIAGLFLFVTLFAFINQDAVTIDDARVGSSQKNVSEVSGWLRNNAKDKQGFILISAASHDAIIFSSGLPMKRFIHEGTGRYWEEATVYPNRWARWIIMRTNDVNDITFKLVSKTNTLDHYMLAGHFPFADIYELKPEFVRALHTEPVLSRK